jgi:transcription antitermination factor NusG
MANMSLPVVESCLTILPPSYLEPHWYAAHVCANHEKRVATELGIRKVQHFLPLCRSTRQWSDRRVQVELPLFPGYLFVRMALQDRLCVLQISSVVRLVGFNYLPTALPDEEIDILRSGLSKGLCVEPHPFLTVGRRVRIAHGPFAGFEGVLSRRRKNLRVVISIELIQRSIAVEVDASEITPCS